MIKFFNKYIIIIQRFILSLTLLLVVTTNLVCFSQSKKETEKKDSSWSLEGFLDKLNTKPIEIINQPLVKLSLISAQMQIPQSKEKFSDPASFELTYGFIRNFDDLVKYHEYYKKVKSLEKLEEIAKLVYFGSEQFSLGNYSSGLSLSSEQNYANDAWYFTFSYENGFGYKTSEDTRLYLAHRTSYAFLHLDIDNNLTGLTPFNQYFDEKVRLGVDWSPSVIFKFGNGLGLQAGYDRKLIYSDFELKGFLLSTLFDNLVQRWIDTQEKKYLEYFGSYYPIFYFLYKNGVSAIFFNQRTANSYFPFAGKEMLDYRGYKLSLTMEF